MVGCKGNWILWVGNDVGISVAPVLAAVPWIAVGGRLDVGVRGLREGVASPAVPGWQALSSQDDCRRQMRNSNFKVRREAPLIGIVRGTHNIRIM